MATNNALRKVSELAPQVRAAVETMLGRTLEDNEMVSVSAYQPHKAPTGAARQTLTRKLKEHLESRAEKVKDVPEAELDDAIDEAIHHVRHSEQ